MCWPRRPHIIETAHHAVATPRVATTPAKLAGTGRPALLRTDGGGQTMAISSEETLDCVATRSTDARTHSTPVFWNVTI